MSFADTYGIRSSTPTFNDVADAVDELASRTQLISSTATQITIDGGQYNWLIGGDKLMPSADRGLWVGDATHRIFALYSSGIIDDGTNIISSGIYNTTIASGSASPNVYINSAGVLKRIV